MLCAIRVHPVRTAQCMVDAHPTAWLETPNHCCCGLHLQAPCLAPQALCPVHAASITQKSIVHHVQTTRGGCKPSLQLAKRPQGLTSHISFISCACATMERLASSKSIARCAQRANCWRSCSTLEPPATGGIIPAHSKQHAHTASGNRAHY
jgi:hypothetical protein